MAESKSYQQNCRYCDKKVFWVETPPDYNGAADAWYFHFLLNCKYNFLVMHIMNRVEQMFNERVGRSGEDVEVPY